MSKLRKRILDAEAAKYKATEPTTPVMSQVQHKDIVRSMTKIDHKYMMGTKAIHLLGDISRETADLCRVYGETSEYYVGTWVTGFGFFNVLFPKNTTRELTPEEVTHWNTRSVQIGSQPAMKLKVD
jgi:hypothetical protein